MKIVPALLSDNPMEFAEQYNKLAPYFDHFSIDVLDGKFAANHTIQPKDIMLLIKTGLLKNIEKKTFDFDLMVEEYETYIEDLKVLKNLMQINRVFLHKRVVKQPIETVPHEFIMGTALDEPDRVESLESIKDINVIGCFQVMTIISGFQGNPFMPELLQKITQLRDLGYRNEIFIDGGVNEKTIPIILASKNPPDFACCGSFLTKADNIPECMEYLKKMGVY